MESRSDDAFSASRSLMNETMDNFMSRSQNCKMDVATENRSSFHRYTWEASMSSNKEKSSVMRVASGSNHVAETSSVNRSGGKACKGKALLMYGSTEVEWLNDRLRTLEEEVAVMKQAFMESMEERNKLMNEVCQQFQVIHHYLASRKQVTGDLSNDGVFVVNPHHKNGSAGRGGLSQLLHQQCNPSLVIRDLRAT